MKWIFLFLVLSGCGYHWQPESIHKNERCSISVPYVAGDADGSLTGEIIHRVALSGLGEIRQFGAQYRLQVAIVGAEGQTIGYRRDRQQISGESQKNLIAAERRNTRSVDATLVEAESGKIVCGPFRIDGDADFDYVDGDSIQDLVFIDPHGVSRVVLPFSLGQLESVEAAEEAAMRPLYVQISKKIVDAIFAEWY